MLLSFARFLLFVYGFSINPPASAAFPCINGGITIAVDISTVLSEANFRKQIAFLSNQVFTDEWTELDRLTLVPYNQRAFQQTFTSDNSAADVRRALAQAKQSRPSNVSTLFAVLDAWQQRPPELPVHLILFVSRIDQAAVDESRPFVESLKQKNYELTFVTVGAQLDVSLLLQLSPHVIQWNVEEQNVPDGWYEQFWTAYGCGDEPCGQTTVKPQEITCPTQTPLPAVTCLTVSTQTPTPATSSCRGGTLAILHDTSGVSLNARSFWESAAFVKWGLQERIHEQTDRFWWGYYSNDDSWLGDFSRWTAEQFKLWLTAHLAQDKEDAKLINALTNPKLLAWADSTSGPITLLVFIFAMNESIVAECKEAAAVLQAKGVRLVLFSLNFDLNIQLMAELTASNDTVQFWDPYWQAEPRDVQRWFDYTIGCPPAELFVPCGDQSGLQINLFFDLNTDTIKNDQLETIKNFLTDEFFDGWTHAERIALVFSCAKGQSRVPPDTFANYEDLTSTIDHAYSENADSCGQGGYIGRNISSAAVYFLRGYGINYYRQAYVAFASTLNDEDVNNIRKASPFIHGPLTIVALNEDVKTNSTKAGIYVIDWSDPNKSAPDDWKRKFWTAFGCAQNPSLDP